MKTFTIYGGSDDLIETAGLPGCDEFAVYPKTAYVGKMRITAGDESIAIHAIYAGHWAFAIGAEDGDFDKMPPWPIRRTWGKDVPYSETVEIDCPDDARLIHTFQEDDE